MKIINKLKEPINKKDLIRVLKNGLLTALAYGVVCGAINYILIFMLNINLNFSLVVLSIFIARSVHDSYYIPHILYPISSLIFLFIGIIISNTITLFAFSFNIQQFHIFLYYGLMNTLNMFNIVEIILSFSIISILNLIITIYIFYYTYQRSKNNYY